MEFCPRSIIERTCEHRSVKPEDLLEGLLRALASYHVFGNTIFTKVQLEGENVANELNGLSHSIKTRSIDDDGMGIVRSLLEAVSMCVGHDYNRNIERSKQMKAEEDETATSEEWFEAMMTNHTIDHQQAMYMLLCETMNEAEKFALAHALGETGDE